MANQWNPSRMPSLQGTRALVSGANSGIGLYTALELARHGAHVLLACRTPAKAAAAASRIREQLPAASLEPLLLDLASLESVRNAASTLLARNLSLDLLINNAGVMAFPQRRLSADGFELQLATNHLGPFALTGLLLPALLAAPAPRVVTVASLAHRNASIHFNDLQLERSYTPWRAYRQTKLANLLFAFELDRRAKAQHSSLRSLAAHPGITHTRIVHNGPGHRGFRAALIDFFFSMMQSAEAGAMPSLYAATEPSLKGGEYVGPSGPFELYGTPTLVHPSSNALDTSAATRLWSLSEQLTGVCYPPLH